MSALTRFLGDTPLRTAVKLAIASFLVGAVMVFMNWHPGDVFAWLRHLALSVWDMGYLWVEYLLLGAAVVVPLFLVVRLISYRGSPR